MKTFRIYACHHKTGHQITRIMTGHSSETVFRLATRQLYSHDYYVTDVKEITPEEIIQNTLDGWPPSCPKTRERLISILHVMEWDA